MLNISEIRKEFDPGMIGINAFRSMIKEYLQCKILEFIYQGQFKDRLIFIGGSKLRLFNNFRRFSEDLDFDLSGKYDGIDHLALSEYLVKEFIKQNIEAEIDQEKLLKGTDVYTRYINFPRVMETSGFLDVPGRKFFIKIDAQKHNYGSYTYVHETKVLNRFDVFTLVRCAPDPMILATKLCSILERSKGRDFYDIIELVKTTRPDVDYIANRLEFGRIKIKYTGPDSYVELIKPVLQKIDWMDKTREIEKFLFNPNESKKVQMFPVFATEELITSWLDIRDKIV
jgi:predicted nucleotidyltransferase component of viral defense system